MMFMDDAIRATIKLMESNPEQLTVRSSYNLAAMSFSPADISESIKKHIPNFRVSYHPDFRQAIAESWPRSIDDSMAKKDWGWEPEFNLENTTVEMLKHLPS
jgi:nucleoside-diphosphate-sugar epimerase